MTSADGVRNGPSFNSSNQSLSCAFCRKERFQPRGAVCFIINWAVYPGSVSLSSAAWSLTAWWERAWRLQRARLIDRCDRLHFMVLESVGFKISWSIDMSGGDSASLLFLIVFLGSCLYAAWYGHQRVLPSLDGSSMQHPAIAQPGFTWEETFLSLYFHKNSTSEPIIPLKLLHRSKF